MDKLNPQVTQLITSQNHPLLEAISLLRTTVLSAHDKLAENIKWNSPNYTIDGNDVITLRTQPPRRLQLVFHRGAKVQAQPKEHLIDDPEGLLSWKENDRAVLTINDTADALRLRKAVTHYVREWIIAVSK